MKKLKEFKAELIPKMGHMSVFAKRKVLNDVLAGEWISNIKMRGVEFAGYRAYTPNDDASLIDWKASLRANKTLIKELEVERSHNVFFLVDVSDSMLFASTEKLKCEFAAEIISSMTFAVLRAGDNVGMGMFTDKVVSKIFPQMGKKQYYRMIKELSNVNKYGGDFDLEKAIKYITSFLNMKCTIIVVSDFIGMKDNWQRYLELIAQNFNLIGMMIRDPRDEELPKNAGHVIIEDPYSKQKIYLDTNQCSKKYAENVKKEKEKIREAFRLTGSALIELRTDEDYYGDLIKFFKRGEKEWS